MSCDVGEVTEISAHSPRFQLLHLRQSSFSNPSLALPTSKLIRQPFRCFTYATAHSPTLLSLFLRHRIFTYVTWRAAHYRNTIYVVFYSLNFLQPVHVLNVHLLPQHSTKQRCRTERHTVWIFTNGISLMTCST